MKSSETSMLLLIGRKVLLDNMSIIHVGWPYGMARNWTVQGNTDKTRGWWMPISVFLYAWFLFSRCSFTCQATAIDSRDDTWQKCFWHCKTESAKHPESKLLLLLYDRAWAAFRSHTFDLEDQIMWDRIKCLIDSAADQPYALEIRYQHKCWLKYMQKYQKMNEDDLLPHMHNVTLLEAQTTLHVVWPRQKSNFGEHELTVVVPGSFPRFPETSQIVGPNIFVLLKRLFGTRCVQWRQYIYNWSPHWILVKLLVMLLVKYVRMIIVSTREDAPRKKMIDVSAVDQTMNVLILVINQ